MAIQARSLTAVEFRRKSYGLLSGRVSEFSLLHSIHTSPAFSFTPKFLFQTLFALIKFRQSHANELEMRRQRVQISCQLSLTLTDFKQKRNAPTNSFSSSGVVS
jgi:hypothetical protein